MTRVVVLALHCTLFAHVEVLDAIVRVESHGNPFALAVNGEVELVRAPASRAEAVAMARWLLANGYNFDAGLAQVNSANFDRLGLEAESVFDPCTNLRAASRVLEECLDRARERWSDADAAWAAALSCYNTGDFTRGVRNGYVAAVTEALGARRGAARPSVQRTTARGARATGGDSSLTRPTEVFGTAVAEAFDARPRGPVR